ncbi:MAG: hypothetical protein JW840_10120 [Candidatus Thermoplasmatota archaeon]|nr:hypothetical protein [Candidatus Thermoplasmatota archaeon]
MFQTSSVLLREITRNLKRKMKMSPLLYTFFSAMVFFSLVMFAFLTYFLLYTEFSLNFMDVFYTVFFLLLMKSASDMHTYFISSPQISYGLSTAVSQSKTVGNVVVTILVINTFLWFSFSVVYLLVLSGLGIPATYPLEYVLFSIDILIALLLGCSLSLHFFSSKYYRMIPTLLLLGFFWLSQSMVYIACMLPLALLHCIWSLSHPMDSYRYVKRKERSSKQLHLRPHGVLHSLFIREVTGVWRERLYFSFVSMSIMTAVGTGYLFLYGAELLIPESLQRYVSGFLPSLFVFLGCYIVVMYTAVFPALNLFLTEEKTMWILRNLPLTNETIIYGKTLALSLSFLTTLPFLAVIPLFLGVDDLFFLLWFLGFSFLAAVIIAVPLGVKYVGKKSDILLLYSVAMILFVLLSVVGAGMNILRSRSSLSILPLCVLLLCLEFVLLFLSLKISARTLAFPFKHPDVYTL